MNHFKRGNTSPNDKLLLVQALRKKGHVVAVTEDGTYDAPALHEADIGLAMGIQGTEVAKESSDIIILDNNFASVVKVVRWGRSVYALLQLFLRVMSHYMQCRYLLSFCFREPLITNIMWRNLLIQALYQLMVLNVLNFEGIKIMNLEHETNEHAKKTKNALIFNAFVFSLTFNEFNARKPDVVIGAPIYMCYIHIYIYIGAIIKGEN